MWFRIILSRKGPRTREHKRIFERETVGKHFGKEICSVRPNTIKRHTDTAMHIVLDTHTKKEYPDRDGKQLQSNKNSIFE